MAVVRHLGLFPFCIGKFPPTTTVNDESFVFQTGPHSLYQFKTTKEEACAIWWRVKEWRLEFTFSEYFDLQLYEGLHQGSFVEVQPTTLTLISGQYNEVSGGGFEHKYTLRSQAQNEVDLVCLSEPETSAFGYYWEWQAQRVGQITYEPDPISGQQPSPTPINYTQNYTASLFTNTDIQQQGFPPAFVYSQEQETLKTPPRLWTAFGINIHNFASQSSSHTANTTTADLRFEGKSIGNLVVGTTTNPNGYSVSLSNVTIEPDSYWPYDPNDGKGPIYDSATGVQLRPFPN